MGIERFFSSIESNKITNIEDTIVTNKRINVNKVYIDFNSEIHGVSSQVISQINNEILVSIKDNRNIPKFTEDELDSLIINKVKQKILTIIKSFTNKIAVKELYLAFDGVPTAGKIIEQRRRRYLGYVLDKIKEGIYDKYSKTIDSSRKEFIKYKVSFDKSKISPATEFLFNLERELRTETFINLLKKEFVNLDKYTVSGYNEEGEGEMKIFWKATDNSLIVSPDSDVTLLGLLLTTKYKNIKILRFNQQKNIYNIIDVDKLKKNLLEYCKSKNNNTIIDLVTIFTFFGNDFVPKVKSINVKSGFKELIDMYLESVSKDEFLVNEKEINSRVFRALLYRLSSLEQKVLQESYVEKNFKNYKYLKSVLGEENFIDNIKNFLDDLKQFNDGKVKHSFKTDKFIKKLRELVRSGETFKSDEHFINSYFKHKEVKGFFPSVNILFRRYSDKIDKEFPNEYEEEIYKLENMKGEYKKLLGIRELELGKIYIDPKTYTFKESSIESSISKYYGNINKTTCIKQFLTAFVFTFRHYIVSNKFVPVSWYYSFNRSPLISDLYDFVKKNPEYINNITLKISKNYFNSVQHLVYITPVEELKPEEFRVKKDKKFLKKLEESIDCTDQIFISKCFIDTNNEDIDSFITKTDKIHKSKNTLRLLGRFTEENEIDVHEIITMERFNNMIK